MRLFQYRSYLCLVVMLLTCLLSFSQYRLEVIITDADNNVPLPGATIVWQQKGQTIAADSVGKVIVMDIPAGKQTFLVTYTGYHNRTFSYSFPLAQPGAVIWQLELAEEEEEEEVIVMATRLPRSLENTPTRMEIISGEELGEKGNMKPGDIRMLLNETTGIQTQQTSATSYNAGIRIQGLEGRYTQLLRDGFPLYGGFAGGLSILQIAPLDLQQVEVIKGASSTLYGGGAIAGLINLVSKTPGSEHELSFMGNATSAAGLDLSGFYSERYGRAGVTVFASRNSTRAYDPADIGLTAIPKAIRYTINPRVFLYGQKTTANIGINLITEDRTGGNIDYIKNGTPGYYESNETDRVTATGTMTHRFTENSAITLKSSYSVFDRTIASPGYEFGARQQSSFSEVSWNRSFDKMEIIAGASLLTDDLAETAATSGPVRDYHFNTYGIFVQNTWTPANWLSLETGLRGDYVNDFGFELLPRLAAMFRLTPSFTTRLGGGFGYKTPTVFSEETERALFRNLLPLNSGLVNNERSIGANWDLNYTTTIGELGVALNHLFFYTRLKRPMILVQAPGNSIAFENADGYLDTRGVETNLRFNYHDFKLFIGYTYTDANTHYNAQKNVLPLTARHRLNNVLMYEAEEKWKIGLEAYYFGPQHLNDGTKGKQYWIFGFMAEKLWKNFSLFINFENFTDTRQTKFGAVYTGTIDAPVFRDIYAPVDGFVVNGGFKIRL